MSGSPAPPSTPCHPVQLDKPLVRPARSRTRRALRPMTRRSAVELFLANPKPRKAPHKPKTLRQTNQDAHRRNVRFYRPGVAALRSGPRGPQVAALYPALVLFRQPAKRSSAVPPFQSFPARANVVRGRCGWHQEVRPMARRSRNPMWALRSRSSRSTRVPSRGVAGRNLPRASNPA